MLEVGDDLCACGALTILDHLASDWAKNGIHTQLTKCFSCTFLSCAQFHLCSLPTYPSLRQVEC